MRYTTLLFLAMLAPGCADSPPPEERPLPPDEPEIEAVDFGQCGPVTLSPRTLIGGLTSHRAIGLDADFLYLSGQGILRVPKGGGKAETISKVLGVSGLVIDDTHIYALDYDNAGAVSRISKEDGKWETIATAERGVEIVQDTSHIYWVNTGKIGKESTEGSIAKWSKFEGGEPTIMVSEGHPHGLAVRGDSLFYVATVLEHDVPTNAILRMHKQGNTPIIVVKGPGIFDVVVEESWVYWLASSSGSGTTSIRRISHAGGEVQTVLTLPRNLGNLAVRGPCVYYVDRDEKAVFRVDPERGNPARVAPLRSSAATIVFDEQRIYLSEQAIGHVWVLGK
jgi:hypothetical protein